MKTKPEDDFLLARLATLVPAVARMIDEATDAERDTMADSIRQAITHTATVEPGAALH